MGYNLHGSVSGSSGILKIQIVLNFRASCLFFRASVCITELKVYRNLGSPLCTCKEAFESRTLRWCRLCGLEDRRYTWKDVEMQGENLWLRVARFEFNPRISSISISVKR